MKKMNFLRVIGMMILVSLVITGCKKDEPNNPPAATNTADLEFEIAETDFQNLKSGDEDVPQCSDLQMDYVKFTFGGQDYVSEIFMANGKLLTKAVKIILGENIASQSNMLTEFLVYNNGDNGIKEDGGGDDVLVRAAPAPNSLYWSLMENPLDIDVLVEAFVKKEIIVDVLCFEDLYYQNFGFTWFESNLVKIERQCWFGDICTGKLADYEGSLYASQSQGLQMDMPAIMRIDVSKKDANDTYQVIKTFDNIYKVDALGNLILDANGDPIYWLGEGDCMEVFWANDEDLTEDFRFDLYVWLPSGPVFDWVQMDFWEFTDGNCPDPSTDGVNDFVIGNCSMPDADFIYPAYQDIPLGMVWMKVDNGAGPGTEGTYFDVSLFYDFDLTDPVVGFDFGDGEIGIWCGDKDETIVLGSKHEIQVVSSLNVPDGHPLFAKINASQIAQLNWLFNNIKTYYPTIDLENLPAIQVSNPGTWNQIQNAIWSIIGDITPASGSMAEDMYDDAQGHGSYVPLPGGYAAVIFWTSPQVQLLFVQVDP